MMIMVASPKCCVLSKSACLRVREDSLLRKVPEGQETLKRITSSSSEMLGVIRGQGNFPFNFKD